MKRRRLIGGLTLTAALALVGCAETVFYLGNGDRVSISGSSVTRTDSGGITLNGQIPIATQPAAIQGPRYAPALLDPLFESTAGAKGVVMGDIDNDGLLDAASISDESQPVQIHLRNADTGLFDTLSIGGAAPISRTVDIEIADFNSDGRLDVAVLINDTAFVPPPNTDREGAVAILLQGADPRNPFMWTRVVPANMRRGGDSIGYTDMVVADYDGVLGPDIIFLSNEPDSVRNVFLFPNPGPARVTDESTASWVGNAIEIDASDIMRIENADVDLDGDTDVFMCAPPAKSFNIRWLRNPLAESGVAAVTGGRWTRRIVGQQQDGGDVIAAGDIDGDGDVDLAASRADIKLTQWFRNPGVTALASEVFPIPWEVFNIGALNSGDINQVRLADLDSDGTLDCFLTASGNVVGFQRQEDVENYWTPFSILATNPVAEIGKVGFADFNGDDRLDFLAPFDREGLAQDQFVIFGRQE